LKPFAPRGHHIGIARECSDVGEAASASGPDFSQGIRLDELPAEGSLSGRVGDDPVLLSRLDGELFAIGGSCTHYGGSLADGISGGGSVRCPLHHACFDLRTGAVLRAPALDPVDRWLVEVEGDRAFVRRKAEESGRPAPRVDSEVRKVVIVGGGAAGLACANELRRRGYSGNITMLSADADPPCDRPNLSKDYLAGSAPEEWLWLRGDDWYADNRIDLRLSTEVTRIDPGTHSVTCASGEQLPFDRLLIATGAEPNRLMVPGFDAPNVFMLRTVADARALSEQARPGARAVIIGASFIALEAAAALRQREVSVDIVSVEEVPLEHVFGKELGRAMQGLHESKGVRFHLSAVVAGFDGAAVTLAGGERIEADFVLVGIGVKPRISLAESAGAAVGNGVSVDAHLQTSLPGIYAAGDIASYPNPMTGEPVRIEHWVVAERQGEVAAANMLGSTERFDSAPFFWTEQYGVALRYVGRGSGWDAVTLEGSFEDGSLAARFFVEGAHCATATIGRDHENLEDELRLEAHVES
jgi:NADPH-dependent 2,4-dienoyl-CoA reductase/sulfur reductase-like enzyme/nitrite reductase/ring-hydroxylating ferredoxin subunit